MKILAKIFALLDQITYLYYILKNKQKPEIMKTLNLLAAAINTAWKNLHKNCSYTILHSNI